jgi:hypothetical protein
MNLTKEQVASFYPTDATQETGKKMNLTKEQVASF